MAYFDAEEAERLGLTADSAPEEGFPGEELPPPGAFPDPFPYML